MSILRRQCRDVVFLFMLASWRSRRGEAEIDGPAGVNNNKKKLNISSDLEFGRSIRSAEIPWTSATEQREQLHKCRRSLKTASYSLYSALRGCHLGLILNVCNVPSSTPCAETPRWWLRTLNALPVSWSRSPPSPPSGWSWLTMNWPCSTWTARSQRSSPALFSLNMFFYSHKTNISSSQFVLHWMYSTYCTSQNSLSGPQCGFKSVISIANDCNFVEWVTLKLIFS